MDWGPEIAGGPTKTAGSGGNRVITQAGWGEAGVRALKEGPLHYATKTGAALAAALLLAIPGTGIAQVDGTFSVEARGGAAIPVGTLDDLTDWSGTAGGTLVWHFNPYWAIRGDVDWMHLRAGENDLAFQGFASPPMDLLYFGGGIEVNFAKPKYQDVPFTFIANLGAGVTQMSVDSGWLPSHPASSFDGSYLTFKGGGQVGWQFSPLINAFVSVQGFMILLNEDDTSVFEDELAGIDAFQTAFVIPITAGVRLTF